MRFLICDVLGQAERRLQIPLGRSPQRLPELLSRAEVAALLGASISVKARTFIMVAISYGELVRRTGIDFFARRASQKLTDHHGCQPCSILESDRQVESQAALFTNF